MRRKIGWALLGLVLTVTGTYLAGWTTVGPCGAILMIPGALTLGINIADILIGHDSWWL